jgi:SulP family sulfate permease
MEHRFRSGLNEMSGALGDLATFLPLAVGLIVVNHVNATALFLSAGLLYVAAGLYYGLPVPVQPLKATSAIAIAIAAPSSAIAAAAFFMGLLFTAISVFDLTRFFSRLFTRPVVRGIQLGLGILLVKGGVRLLSGSPAPGSNPSEVVSLPATIGIGVVVAALILLSRENRRYPAALAVLLFGALCGLFLPSHAPLSELSLGWIRPAWGLPWGADLYLALVVLLLPQVPLTVANSMVATADAAHQYFGEEARRVTPRSLAASLGLANLLSGSIGGMPVCHGSGGLTAHYRFGARTGRANLFIGGLFVILALFFGRSIPVLFGLVPSAVLAVLLIYVGVEHARLVRDVVGNRRESAVVAAVGLVALATGNLAGAFVVGIGVDRIGRAFPASGKPHHGGKVSAA